MQHSQINNLLPWFSDQGDKFLPPQSKIKDLLLSRDPYQIYDYASRGIIQNGNGSDDDGILIHRFSPYQLEWIDLVNLCRPHLPPDESISRTTRTISKTTITEIVGVRWKITKIWDNALVDPVEISYQPYLGDPPAFLSNSSFPNQTITGGVNTVRYVYDSGTQLFYQEGDWTWQIVYPTRRFVYYYLELEQTDYEQVTQTIENFTGIYDADFNSWGMEQLLLYQYNNNSFFFSDENSTLFSFKSIFTPVSSEVFTLTYYLAVKSFEYWEEVILEKHHQQFNLVANEPIEIKIPYGIVAHSLLVKGANKQQFIQGLVKNPQFTPEITINQLFPPISLNTIAALNQSRRNIPRNPPPLPINNTGTGYSYRTIYGRVFYLSSRVSNYWAEVSQSSIPDYQKFFQFIYYANNNIWNNSSINSFGDLNYKPEIYMGDELVLNRFFSYSTDVLDLNYTMPTSPYFLESLQKIEAIHKALDAEKYSFNEIDPSSPRVSNLGYLIERAASVLGLRFKADGTIDEELEKSIIRRHVEGSDTNNIQEYHPNCFGSKGTLLRCGSNKFAQNGIVSGGYRKIHDLPQYLAELHEQANAAMGYQEGTAIEIQLDGKTYRYPNQLALLIELFVTTKQTAIYSKGAFFSSIIGEQSIKEVIAGLGLRTVDKFLEFKVAGKPAKLYYKGISASQSIRRKMSAITTNIGMVLGNII
jgi:hypothetical protein